MASPLNSALSPSARTGKNASGPENTFGAQSARSGTAAAQPGVPLPGANARPATPGTNANTNTDRIQGQTQDRTGMKPSAPYANAAAKPSPASQQQQALSPAALESRVNAAVADTATATADGPDFSTATPEELGDAAANAAEDMGRVLVSSGGKADISSQKNTIAAVRSALTESGATEEQLQDFDASVTVLATQSGLVETGSPLADTQAQQQSRFTLQATTLAAFDEVKDGPNGGLAETLTDMVSDAKFGRIPPATNIDTEAMTGEEIGVAIGNIAIALGNASTASAPGGASEQARTEALGRYAAIRDQLEDDGASFTALQSLDDYMVELGTEAALSGPGTRATDGSAIARQDTAFGGLDEQIDAIARTHLVRESRQNPASLIDEDSARDASTFVDVALRTTATTPFDASNFDAESLSVASIDELAGLLNTATREFVVGESERGSGRSRDARMLFAQVRDEILTRSNETELPADVANIIEERAATMLSNIKAPSAEKQERVRELRDALRFAVAADLLVDGPVGIQNVQTFEGTNGEEPADIFIIEFKPTLTRPITPPPASDPDRKSETESLLVDHNVAVENVITNQLEAAGQGYSLTEVQVGPRNEGTPEPGDRTALKNDLAYGLLPAMARAEETGGPVYVNASFGSVREPDFYQRGLEAVAGTDLVEGLDLSVDIEQGNIGDYADAIRDLAFAVRERPEIAEMLGRDAKEWRGIARDIEGLETAIQSDIHIFVAMPNGNAQFNDFQFAKDDGAKGSITYVAQDRPTSPVESDDFVLPGQGETPTVLVAGENVEESFSDSFYRGEGVDVYAPGAPFGRNLGSSFAAPEMLVNTVLGTFDPKTETRIG